MSRDDALGQLVDQLPDGAALVEALSGPFRRAVRRHPGRGRPDPWPGWEPVPWHAAGFFHAPSVDPADRLAYHTGALWPQDAASQVPVLMLDPQPGEVVVDCCAAPGSKSTQIGLAQGDAGLLICCDASPGRRRILPETLARQGVATGLVTPLPLARLAERAAAVADAVLVDAPCSGHQPRSLKQVARQAQRQQALLTTAARLVAPGGRLVYSTCTPYPGENEAVVTAFLAGHPGWTVRPVDLPGTEADLSGLGGLRCWPHRQGTEPFFAIRLDAPATGRRGGLAGELPPAAQLPDPMPLPDHWHCWERGGLLLAAPEAVAACALPSDARGLLVGNLRHGRPVWTTWAVQALLERGAPAETVSVAEGLRLWAGGEADRPRPAHAWVRVSDGQPLGALDGSGRRLRLPSRLVRRVAAV